MHNAHHLNNFMVLQQGEELTIYYGDIWFDDATETGPGRESRESCMHEHMDDEQMFLAGLEP